MRSTLIMRTRAAASSMARGMPSRRWQMAATAGALSSVMAKFGRAARARSVNSRTASEASRDSMSMAPVPRARRGRAPAIPPRLAIPSGSREVARMHQAPATAHQRLGQGSGGGEHVLAVVQHDKGASLGRARC